MLNEKLLIDTVIENGNNGTWRWTKWKSGKIELYGRFAYTGLNITQQSQGTYYGASKSETLPFYITTLLYIGSSSAGSLSSGIILYRSSVSGQTVTTEFRTHTSQTGAVCGVNYYIVGYL